MWCSLKIQTEPGGCAQTLQVLIRHVPKTSTALPCLARLVDGSTGHKVFDFMDVSRGYHQIKMYPEDKEKTDCITEYELYCWKVMPLGLRFEERGGNLRKNG
ncbi:hypothetical protein LIER_40501 [Lithospermum erythrorhizon]|uniref:Reverse transcriptase n=1 Tax=Lithospermum erythrorhizon TaxID=34254 RepID=A0AAV3QYY9_LITER